MEPKDQTLAIPLIFLLLMLAAGFASSDIAQDRAECANDLVGLAGCLPYVGGTAKAPTIDCCSGLKQVLDKSKKCLCVLIKDKDDPSLGLKINATLAATLPSTCRAPVNISDCISLLHLAPNSTEAKLFEGYEKLAEGKGGNTAPAASVKGNSTGTGSASSAQEQSDGGKGKSLQLGVEMLFGVCVATFTWLLLF